MSICFVPFSGMKVFPTNYEDEDPNSLEAFEARQAVTDQRRFDEVSKMARGEPMDLPW